MKSAARLLIPLLIAIAAWAQETGVPTAALAPRGLDDASISDGVYTNNFFGFSYTLPPGFKDEPASVGAVGADGYMFRLLFARIPQERQSVTILADASPCPDTPADDACLGNFGALHGDNSGVPSRTERFYAGRKFFVVSRILEGYARSAYVTRWRGYALTFILFAPTEAQLPDLASSLDTLNFFGPDTPLPLPPPSTPNTGSVWTREGDPASGCTSLILDRSGNRVPLRVRVSQGVAQGMIQHKVAPVYPPLARQARIQGQVVLAAVVGCDGAMQSLRVVSGHPLLGPAAMDAVKQWRYSPYLLNGKTVEVETQITVNFTLKK